MDADDSDYDDEDIDSATSSEHMSNLASQRPNPSIIEVFEEINNELQNDSEVQSEQMDKEDRETYMLALRTI